MSNLADLLPATAEAARTALAPHTDRDWHRLPAGDLEWTCWKTALHVVDDLYFYAMQVLYARADDYVCTELASDEHANPTRLIDAIVIHAELLRRVAVTADPGVRGHHVYGLSDPAGFAAMGIVETLIHTYDLVRGLNPDELWRPPDALAGPVLARLFPDAPAGEPGDVLLYCCGRAPLGDRPRQTDWTWDGTVRG
jgi:hypothetical protein